MAIPTKKKKVVSRKNLRTQCDKLWGLCIRARDKHVCQYNYCNKPANNPHHIFTKGGHPSTRHDLENGITLCVYCHRGIAHGKPQVFEWFINRRLGPKRYNLLMLRANSSGKNDLEMIKIGLKEYLKELEV